MQTEKVQSAVMPQPAPRRFEFSAKQKVLALLLAVAALITLLSPVGVAPASASFSLPIDTIWDSVSSFANQFWPIFAVPIGLGVALAIIGFIGNAIIKAVRGGSK